jgi:hypothetical protein
MRRLPNISFKTQFSRDCDFYFAPTGLRKHFMKDSNSENKMIENVIKNRMAIIGISADFLCALDAGISNARLSNALRGLKALDNATAVRLLDLLDDLAKLKRYAGPIPVELSNATVIRRLLVAQRDGELPAMIRDNLNQIEANQ